MTNEEIVKSFGEKVHKDLYDFLRYKEAIDERLPECPDVEERFNEICKAYLPDGAREFQEYPVFSLGCMMFIGMAMACYWDKDWEKYANRTDYYEEIRDKEGYDHIDDTVLRSIMGYEGEAEEKMSELIAECASRTYNLLRHEPVEPGTQVAFGCYVEALRQLYIMGMALALNALGYHMTAYNPAELN